MQDGNGALEQFVELKNEPGSHPYDDFLLLSTHSTNEKHFIRTGVIPDKLQEQPSVVGSL